MGQIEKERLLRQLGTAYRDEAMEAVHDVDIWNGVTADGLEGEDGVKGYFQVK